MCASRIYYALFLGSVGEFEKHGVQPQNIDRGAADAAESGEGKWTHSFVKNNLRMLGLDPDQCRIVKQALTLRVVADYKTEEVNLQSLNEVIQKAPDILECLGVIV